VQNGTDVPRHNCDDRLVHAEPISTVIREMIGSFPAAQYRELAGFAQFGSDLDKATRSQLDRGERLVELLKQRQYEPLSIEKQIVILYAGSRGLLDKYAVADILSYETELYGFLEMKHPVILATLPNTKQIDESLTAALDGALNQFAAVFKTTPPLAAAA
jgi:F-type H+-transporting ATPase subunit alpha